MRVVLYQLVQIIQQPVDVLQDTSLSYLRIFLVVPHDSDQDLCREEIVKTWVLTQDSKYLSCEKRLLQVSYDNLGKDLKCYIEAAIRVPWSLLWHLDFIGLLTRGLFFICC